MKDVYTLQFSKKRRLLYGLKKFIIKMVLNKKIVLKTFYNYNTIKQTLTREREYGFNTKQNY